MFSQSTAGHNLEELQALTMELGQYVHDATRKGVAAHVVEKGIWNRVLEMGRQALGGFIAGQGDGDVGETFMMPDGQVLKRPDRTHTRPYQSILWSFRAESCGVRDEGEPED